MFHRMLDHTRFHIPLIVLLCLLLYFPFLGARDFWDHENEYAEVTRVMRIEGNYLLPQLNGQHWAEKPVLFFWLALFFSWLAGQVNEWTVRLPSALSATGLTLIYYHFVRKRFGARLAFLSTLTLATSLLTVHVERHLPVNMLFFLFVTLSMFLIIEVLVFGSTRKSHVYGVWFFMGLACLTKGPLAILFPGVTVFLYLFVSRRWKDVLALRPLTGASLFLGIAVPWFALAIWKTSGAWANAFFTQQYIWYYASHLGHDLGSVSYYGFNFPLGLVPWTFLIVPAAISLWPDRAKIREGNTLFMFVWFLSVLVFAPVSEGQHGHDLYLVFPSVALALGVYLNRLISSAAIEVVQVWTRRFVLFGCFMLIFAGLSAPLVTAFVYHWPAVTTSRLVPIGLAYVVEGLWILYALRNRSYHTVVIGFAVLSIVSNLLLHVLLFPAFNRLKPRLFAEKMGAIVRSASQVGVYKSGTSYKFNFYSQIKRFEQLNKPEDVVRFLSSPGPKFILVRDRRMSEIKVAWQRDMSPVLTESIGSERWLLLYSCTEPCGPVPPAAESGTGSSHSFH